MERKIEAKAKGGPRWVPSGPRRSHMIVWSILSHHKKTRVRLVKLHGSYSHFRKAAYNSEQVAAANPGKLFP